MLPHVVLAPSSTVFLFPSTKILYSSIFSNVGVSKPMLLTRKNIKRGNEIFIRRNRTFLLFESEEGESVGSGMKLAMIAKKITPPKNCQHDKQMNNYNNNNKSGSSQMIQILLLKKNANPKIPLQEANGVNSIMSQIEERYAQHQTSSKTLHTDTLMINMCSRL